MNEWTLVGEHGPEFVVPKDRWPFGAPKEEEPKHPWDQIVARHKLMVCSTLAHVFWQFQTISWELRKLK